MPARATRLVDAPIVHPNMDARMGANIAGPSIIAMPDWAETRLGRDETGPLSSLLRRPQSDYIRLAFADALTGPWRLHSPGVLDLKDSLFEPVDPPEPAVEHRPDWAQDLKGGYLYAHIASPDVHIDHADRVIRMYYHGLLWNGDQQTRLAVSRDGLAFTPRAPLLGPPYFRAFRFGTFVYALTWGGEIWRAAGWEGPFERGPRILPCDIEGGRARGIRHGDVHRVGETLHLFYTRMGDRPERILHTRVRLDGAWMNWTAGRPRTVLAPALSWEGGDLALRASCMGAAEGPVRELRDPNVFEDVDGKT